MRWAKDLYNKAKAAGAALAGQLSDKIDIAEASAVLTEHIIEKSSKSGSSKSGSGCSEEDVDLEGVREEKGEKKRECAEREVEEETGVKVRIEKKINATWHTYVNKKKYVLKKTHWYVMKCVDDTNMGPQVEEDIDEVRWMTLSELRAALYNSYRSIRVVVQEYHKLLKIHDQSL